MNNSDPQRIKNPILREIAERNPVRPDEEQAPKPETGSAPTPANDNAAFFVPGMDDFMRAMPNHIARSSFFAPVARGRRRHYKQLTTIVSRGDVEIMYKGEQLDEADADLFLQLISLAKGTPLGEPVYYNRAQLIRSLGRSHGTQQYEWLDRRLLAFSTAAIRVKTKAYVIGEQGKQKTFGILSEYGHDEAAGMNYFIFNTNWHKLFLNREYALIDWEKRLEIGRGHDMAKALQRLFATSADPVQRYGLEWLKDKLQYTGRLRDFKNALLRATAELGRVEVIAGGGIERSTKGNDQLVIKLPGSC